MSPLSLLGPIGASGEGGRIGQMQGQAVALAQKLGVKVGASKEEAGAAAEKALGIEPGSANSNEPVYSSTGKSMLWKGKHYVLIHSKWHLARSDHTYTVDGTRIFFKDTGKFAQSGDSAVSQPTQGASTKARTGASHQATQKAQGLLEKISGNPFSAYSPDSMQEMAQTMEAAKKALEERNKVLKELSEAR